MPARFRPLTHCPPVSVPKPIAARFRPLTHCCPFPSRPVPTSAPPPTQLPNTAGLFVGGLFLGFGLVAIGAAIYYFWSKRQEKYTGLA